MRILGEAFRGPVDADFFEGRAGAAARLATAEAGVQAQGLLQLPADGQERVQRGHRILEHHADVAAAQPPCAAPEQFAAVEAGATGEQAGAGRQ
ncbi:MAG: hypothetical protein KatS3mg121_1408 [Gammaproteobacteria bacterium]|nr:MAG: hypothetical protein KatS3mg121_1408 [Gammaproteobacteria bacterium]